MSGRRQRNESGAATAGTTMRALCRSDTGRRLHGVVSNLPALNESELGDDQPGRMTHACRGRRRWRSPQLRVSKRGRCEGWRLPYGQGCLYKFESSGIK
ncbi:hypothetical protein AVEN_21243-1 [Araneus ventricosus]|uniref:Uncharacterized protein n=1 Tax=Araneus ventricosus TaxID=182803 RepID=A0A4Y2GGT4_ARAVE|nr:hypothetical protein AVEN_21243-1 [Araneus ventricosus]